MVIDVVAVRGDDVELILSLLLACAGNAGQSLDGAVLEVLR